MPVHTIASFQPFVHHSTESNAPEQSTFLRSFHVLIADIDGTNKIAEVVVALFALADAFWESTPKSVKRTFQVVQDYIDVTIFISLCKRMKDWTLPDDKGKMIWEYSWQYVSCMVCFTASQIFTTIGYLHTLAVISVGAALEAVNNLSSFFMMFSCAFEIWVDTNTLQGISTKQAKACMIREKWVEWKNRLADKSGANVKPTEAVETTWTAFCTKKIQKWEQRISQLHPVTQADALERATEKKRTWIQLNSCKNLQSIEKFCVEKADKWDKTFQNYDIERKKLFVNMAMNACCVALFASGFIFAGSTLFAIECALIILTIVTDALDLINYIMDELLPAHKIPTVALPV